MSFVKPRLKIMIDCNEVIVYTFLNPNIQIMAFKSVIFLLTKNKLYFNSSGRVVFVFFKSTHYFEFVQRIFLCGCTANAQFWDNLRPLSYTLSFTINCLNYFQLVVYLGVFSEIWFKAKKKFFH